MCWRLLLLKTQNFPEHSINIQYKYNISVKQWEQLTGPPTPNMPKGVLRYSTGSRCPARINKMILKLCIFTSI
jgi:hypothetical protein